MFGVSATPNLDKRPGPSSRRTVIGVHPGSSVAGATKRWGVGNYQELMRRCGTEFDCDWLVFGGSGEEHLAEQLQAVRPERITAVVGLPFASVVRHLDSCDLFVANDSALMHIAALRGVPVLALWAYSDYHRTSPFGARNVLIRAKLACSPCLTLDQRFVATCPSQLHCIRSVTVDEVWPIAKLWMHTCLDGRELLAERVGVLPCVAACTRLSHGCLVVDLARDDFVPLLEPDRSSRWAEDSR